MNITEYETKQLLTSSEYETLLIALNNVAICKEIIQINYYFDDKNFRLCEKGDTLRVRQKSGILSLERKYNKRYSSDGVKICDESSEDIQSFPLLIMIDDKEYHYIGNLITVRKNYEVAGNLISLDTNYYLGEVDYEIEIESDKAVCVPDFIAKIVKFENRQVGKYTRFVQKLKELNLQYEL